MSKKEACLPVENDMDNIVENREQPKITVIMPAYNAEQFIEAAIRSVMAQTVTDWELLVIDDGSRDGSCAVVEMLAAQDPRVRLLRNEQNMGVANTRNRGLSLCRGQFAAFLDSDDIWLPDKLEKQLQLLENTGAELCYTSYGIMDAQGTPSRGDYLVPAKADFGKLLKENVIGCSTVLLRQQTAQNYRFDTGLHHEDYALWLRMLKDGVRAAGCTEVLVRWRLIENSRSFDKRKSARSRWIIYRDYMKLPLHQSVWAFGNYAFASVKKYFLSK